jgi:serine/threonine protein kinase
LTLDNILVSTQNNRPIFKVCDFGVGAIHEDKHLIIRGKTRNYSPEAIIDKNNYVTESDVYSFGLIIYEILHNVPVWSNYSSADGNKAVLRGELPENKVNKKVPKELVNIMYKCLEFE